MGDHGEEDEVYLGDGQGGIDGVVVADLEGQDGEEQCLRFFSTVRTIVCM